MTAFKKPVIVLPIHSPDGTHLTLLHDISSQLADLFEHAFINISPATARAQSAHLQWMEASPFFHMYVSEPQTGAGDHFCAASQLAVDFCPPQQVVHICGLDRVAYALQSEHSGAFCDAMRASAAAPMPLLYARSESAWQTHPANYRELETILTRAGEMLFGQTLDFAWCQFAATAGQLAKILPHCMRHDISTLAEYVLLLRKEIHVEEVDWLAWEDPHVFGCSAAELKAERESSLTEVHKRLSYVIPKLQLLLDHSMQEIGR